MNISDSTKEFIRNNKKLIKSGHILNVLAKVDSPIIGKEMIDLLIESGYDSEMVNFNYTVEALTLKKYLEENHKFPILIRSFSFNPMRVSSISGGSKLKIIYSVILWQNYDRTILKGVKITDFEGNDNEIIRAISNDIMRRNIL